jgi:hypothetical protein
MALGGYLPDGARFHSAGPTPTGFRVIDCWDDAAAFDHFAAEEIGPQTQKQGMRPPRMTVLDVDDDMTGPLTLPEVAMFIRFAGMDREMFHRLDDQVLIDGQVPEGLIQHVNGPYDGGWYVVDLWASEAKRTAFMESRVKPAAASVALPAEPTAASVALPAEPTVEILPVHGAMVEHAATRA